MYAARGWRRTVLAAVAAAVSAAGCGAGQDPGVPTGDGDGSRPSSQTLPPCPAGGPDATTPAAGCLDRDGDVVRP